MSKKGLFWGLDSRAAWMASLIGAVLLLVLLSLCTHRSLGRFDFPLPLILSLWYGGDILSPEATLPLTLKIAAAGLVIFFGMLYAWGIIALLHRWGIVVGSLGGGLIGVALYVMHWYGIMAFSLWREAIGEWMVLLAHIGYGVTVGFIYEWREAEASLSEET